jgi:acetyltransferase-like isoleucine patch superfamily enzyme
MSGLWGQMKAKAARDRGQGVRALVSKGWDYAIGLLTARLYLRSVSRVGRGVRTLGRPRIENYGTMELHDHVQLRSILVPVELTCGHGAVLEIGEDTFLNYGVSIGATGEIRLGKRVNVGPYVMIIDTQFHDAHDRNKVPPPRPVIIEDDVFLGAKCSVMPGVRIGRASIVGVGSVVTKDVPPFTVVGGVPAVELRKLDESRFVVRNR